MVRQEDIKNIIRNYNRRLQLLKEQKALAGRATDPGILIEIEDIEAEIRDLQVELAVIERRIKPYGEVSDSISIIGYEETQRTTPPYILIIDDEPDFLDNVSLTLTLAGYQILIANDGVEALTMLQNQPVDMIISDISMPHMGGYQLYNRVCENSQWVTIPFIFLTARTLGSDVRFGKELGVDDYLTKPIGSEDLLSVVRGKLRRREITTKLETIPALSVA